VRRPRPGGAARARAAALRRGRGHALIMQTPSIMQTASIKQPCRPRDRHELRDQEEGGHKHWRVADREDRVGV
jgi:hypothetical protein